MLLIGAGLTTEAFAALLHDDPGFDPSSTLTFTVPLPESQYPKPADQGAFHDALRRELERLPGVSAVGASTALPLTQETNQQAISFPDAPGNTGDSNADRPLIDFFRVTPDYFEAAGHRLLAGRDFDARDADTTSFSIVIDDVLANRFFPGGAAVGAHAAFFGDTATIVGVIDQARLYDVHADDRGQVYLPAQRFPAEALSYALRTDGVAPESLVTGARETLRAADPAVPMADVRTLDQIVAASLGRQRSSLALILAFAAGSLLLASLGLYGVVTNMVISQRREIGVRIALGADRREVVRLVVGQGMRLASLGAVAGLAGALVLSGFVDPLVLDAETSSPLIYGGVATGLLCVATLASWLPARRATEIDPMTSLRAD